LKLGWIQTVFSLWLDLNQDFTLAHDLYYFADVAARFMKQLELFTEEPDWAGSKCRALRICDWGDAPRAFRAFR
jgi:hypothetical protein